MLVQGTGSVDVAVLGDAAAAQRMAAAARGDAVAFVELCESYAPSLLGAVLRVLGDRTAAETALLSVFLAAWRGARSFDPRRFSVRAWWTIGARNAALRALPEHRSTRMASTHDTQIATLDASTEAADVAPMRQRVQSAMLTLGGDPRSALQLAYFEGLSAAEIADRSRLSPDLVRYQVADALRRFAAALAGRPAEDGALGPGERLAAAYLLGELGHDDAARFELGEATGEVPAAEVAALRDAVHGVALYTFPSSPAPWLRARLLAAITGPERLSPFADDLAALLRIATDDARELLARVDDPHGWADDGPGVRVLSIETDERGDTVVDVFSDPDTTMVQRPAWPRECLIRVAAGSAVPSRFPHSDARALVLQGSITQGELLARAGDLLGWPAGTALGVATGDAAEVIAAVAANPATRPGRRAS